MRLSEVIDDLYDRVLGCQDALQEDELPEWDEGEDIDSIPEPAHRNRRYTPRTIAA